MDNNIQITVENVPQSNSLMDDMDVNWDPMKEEFDNPDLNCYDHGPGADLDVSLQRPAYRDHNNQIVFKVMVSRIPYGLKQTGLENLFRNVGVPNVAKCHKSAENHLNWALIEFKTLAEAKRAIVELDGFFNMRVNFARSDEENERIKKKRLEEEKTMREIRGASALNMNVPSTTTRDESVTSKHAKLLRMLGRGRSQSQSRGNLLFNVYNEYQQRRPGLKHCAWSNGVPDMRDPGGLMYNAKSCNHQLSNRVLQKQTLFVTAGSNSVRQVSMGRGYIPPLPETKFTEHYHPQQCVGIDVSVPILPCTKCGSETIDKCSICGSPYCSKKCQKEDFGRHKPKCRPQASIDIIVDDKMQRTIKLAPLTKKPDEVQKSPFTVNTNNLWGKPAKNVVFLLDRGTEATVAITLLENSQCHGGMACKEVFELTRKLFEEMPTIVMQGPRDQSFWPSVGTLVAVQWQGSIWRGYILNTPVVGTSLDFTVALCDIGCVKKIESKDMFSLPPEYHILPELSVTCTLESNDASLISILAGRDELSLSIVNTSDDKLTANCLALDGKTVLGSVIVSPWKPVANELVPIQIIPPCSVVLSAYHNQHALYVRPSGRVYKEQLFSLMQRVAALHVTTGSLGRAPYKEEMVACQYENDTNYYRGIVRGESPTVPGHYEVFFVDFGNIESVSANDMKALPNELKACPCMAIPVKPYGVRAGPLTENSVNFLNLLLRNEQEFLMDFATENKHNGVQLFFPDKSSFNLKLNEQLSPEWEQSLQKGLTIHDEKPTMFEDLSVIPLVEGGGQKGSATVMIMNISANGCLAVLPMGTPEVEHVLQTVAYQINEYCEATDSSARYNPRVNEVCLAKYQKDGHWYRALNTETVTETQSSKLMFLDYGNNEDVPFQDIRPMVPDFVSAPVVMVMCYLDGMPMEPHPNMVQRLKELVPTKTVYEVEVLSQINSYQYKISIPQISNQLKSELSVNQV